MSRSEQGTSSANSRPHKQRVVIACILKYFSLSHLSLFFKQHRITPRFCINLNFNRNLVPLSRKSFSRQQPRLIPQNACYTCHSRLKREPVSKGSSCHSRFRISQSRSCLIHTSACFKTAQSKLRLKKPTRVFVGRTGQELLTEDDWKPNVKDNTVLLISAGEEYVGARKESSVHGKWYRGLSKFALNTRTQNPTPTPTVISLTDTL
jgi:hypothetical protein